MEELGRFGFWLAVGLVIAASIVADALKEREKERQKQETLREMMRQEAEGKLTPETLAYMRERDAAEQAERARALLEEEKWGPRVLGGFAALVVGVLSFIGGVAAFREVGERTESWQIAVPVMLGIWATGLLIAVLIYRGIRGRKKATPPGA